ncbi:hypothetical protein ACFL5H_02780 [Candidatus Latescibacterota bacterium]
MDIYTHMLTLTLFLCSVGILSNYIRDIIEQNATRGPISASISNIIININYMAVILPWLILILLVLFPEPECNKWLYKYAIRIPLIISIFIFTFTLIGGWFAKGLNSLISMYVNRALLKVADEDLDKLYKDDDISNDTTNNDTKT